MTTTHHDVLIIGGGAAGLSAATTLARSLRDVLVVDAGEPRNAPAHAAHNLLGREGINPLELLAAGRAEAEAYGARIVRDRAVSINSVGSISGEASVGRGGSGFAVELGSGATATARRLLLATGLVDELPDVPGLREHWGSRVLHCPYCHGWEVRGRKIGVLASSPMAVHQALLFRQLSEDVTVFLHEQPGFGPEEAAQLEAIGVRIMPGRVVRVESGPEGTTPDAGQDADAAAETGLGVVLEDGARMDVDALAVGPRMVARGELYEQLGGTLSEHPMGLFIETGPMGKTPLDGVWAAGNANDLAAMVSVAGGAGTMAAAAINADLAGEDARAAALAMTRAVAASR
ncbi:NAD(P)/FAD-dependent oxidoreductase [Arthrobacter ginkgonis]|uniref:NAD(P)/FAD-dependent oxidoreductase n=1 Tax=Arthrobacter ginkgonis TaxID=1630594 RepID=A0ABP7DAM5_9MICC